jgi:chromate transporter
MAPSNLQSESTAESDISCRELAIGFLLIGLTGFGGVQATARKVIVEQRCWLSEADFAAVLGVGQILPGANTVNAAVIIGDRFQGVPGSLTAVSALLFAPIGVLLFAALLYDRFGGLPDVRAALSAVAAGAAGMVIGTGLKMGWRLKPNGVALVLGAAAFIAVGILGGSIPLTVAILLPVGLASAMMRRGL